MSAVAKTIWSNVSERMRQDIGDAAWRSWIKPLIPFELEQNLLILHTDNQLLRDRALSQYADRLRLHVKGESSDIDDIVIRLKRKGSK